MPASGNRIKNSLTVNNRHGISVNRLCVYKCQIGGDDRLDLN